MAGVLGNTPTYGLLGRPQEVGILGTPSVIPSSAMVPSWGVNYTLPPIDPATVRTTTTPGWDYVQNESYMTMPARMATAAAIGLPHYLGGALGIPGKAYTQGATQDEMIRRSADLASVLAMGGAGSAAVRGGVERGVVGSAPVPRGSTLPMDYASRMARAKAAGARPDMPVYRGMNVDVTAFDPKFRGTGSGSEAAKAGVSVALDPEVANEFARRIVSAKGGNEQIYPLIPRMRRPAQIVLDGTETDREIAVTLYDLWDRGYDAVLFRNYTTPKGLTGRDILFVKDENQLRSPAAAFDPAKANSPDLLAANRGPVLLPTGGGPMTSDELAKQIAKSRGVQGEVY